MKLTVQLDDELASQLSRAAATRKRPRNELVVEATEQWLDKTRRSTWPSELTDFEPFTDLERFESHRSKKPTARRFP